MAQYSLRSLLMFSTYVAICSLVFVFPSLWIGTLVIFATILLLSSITISAHRQQNVFWLGYSIFAWSWLVFWLGFYAQTGPNSKPWSIPSNIAYMMRGFRDFPHEAGPHLGNEQVKKYGVLHSLHMSAPMATWGDPKHMPAPSHFNAIRLAVCLTSLAFGVLGGVLFPKVASRVMKMQT